MVMLYLVLIKPSLEYYAQFCLLQFKEEAEEPGTVGGKGTKMMKNLELNAMKRSYRNWVCLT